MFIGEPRRLEWHRVDSARRSHHDQHCPHGATYDIDTSPLRSRVCCYGE